MPSRAILTRIVAILTACGLSLAAAGCARKQAHAAPPAPAPAPSSAAAARPMTAAPDTTASPPVETAASPPVLPAASTPPPVPVPASRLPAPRRPAGERSTTEAEAELPEHPAAPQISPQLSPSDQASYKRRTGEDISVAERNLQQASGRQLSAAQQDLVEKIRSFLAQSRDASTGGDWARAQNLAQKARLLSIELLNSL
jgi:hypothetical protein